MHTSWILQIEQTNKQKKTSLQKKDFQLCLSFPFGSHLYVLASLILRMLYVLTIGESTKVKHQVTKKFFDYAMELRRCLHHLS